MTNVYKAANSLFVSVKNRKKVFFDGKAKSITSLNLSGEFDILPQHANFVTLIKDYLYIDRGLETEQKIDIKTGLLAVRHNKVDIYLDF